MVHCPKKTFVVFCTCTCNSFILPLKIANQRCLSLSPPRITFKTFFMQLKTKIKEKDGLPQASAAVAAIPRKSDGQTPAPAESAPTTKQKSDAVCFYCKQVGHTTARCFACKKDEKMAKAALSACTGAVPKRASSSARSALSTDSQSAKTAATFSHFHMTSSHSTEGCHYLKTLRARRSNWEPTGKPSGFGSPDSQASLISSVAIGRYPWCLTLKKSLLFQHPKVILSG